MIKILVLLLLFLTLCYCREENDRHCQKYKPVTPRPHSIAITEFGAVGDGKTLNTHAFQNAIFYLQSFFDKGGAELYIPPGRWLTGSLNLTSYMTLYLERDAVILGSQDFQHWEIVRPLPSYGRGIDFPGWRYNSLLTGYNVTDVVITGNNGVIEGQGSSWWEAYDKHSLNNSRPHLLEFVDSSNVVISNVTFLNSPAWSIHPVYCNEVVIENIIVHAPPESPYTSGIVPDSSVNICIRHCNVSTSYDAIALKSGWDEYGIAYAKPILDIHLHSLHLQSSSGSGVAFGSEMSGGIANILVEKIHLHDSHIGFELKTTKGRGGFLQDISILDSEMQNVGVALKVTGDFGTHPDNRYDPRALPVVQGIKFSDMIGQNISMAGVFSGIHESPFTWFVLSNITFQIRPKEPSSGSSVWTCSAVYGTSDHVVPEPCPELQLMPMNTPSFSILKPAKGVAAL